MNRSRLNSKRRRFYKHLRRWKLYISLAIILGVSAYVIALGTIQFTKQLFNITAHAPTVARAETVEPTPTPTLTEREQIEAYIREVFGEHADKAFQVLKCENGSLNPKAVNTAGNHPAGSRDIGVFQINEYWQKTQGKFLFNWKINVEIAHQLYTENGNSFRLWTCGRNLGL
jgi:hypothetical protein